jgi:hypothetical protein
LGEITSVTTESDCRKNAATLVDLASRATTAADKGRLLASAEAWLDLADRVHKMARRRVRMIGEHPLISTKLGRYN